MRYLLVRLISFYQRFLSPHKGFRCAYRVRHQEASCSSAVKTLILRHGVLASLPLIRDRFRQCKAAYNDLKSGYRVPQSADLPCDVSCAGDVFDCGGSRTTSADPFDCCDVFDLLGEWKRLSARAKRRIAVGVLLLVLVLSYVFYGRGISAVYLTDLGLENQTLIKRLSQREEPHVRGLLLVDGQKVYTDIVQLGSADVEYKLNLEKTIFSFDIERIEILDARINVANKLLVVGQVIDAIDLPEKEGQGKRFEYRIKRRWHL